jgi:sulfatase modifying factor 1
LAALKIQIGTKSDNKKSFTWIIRGIMIANRNKSLNFFRMMKIIASLLFLFTSCSLFSQEAIYTNDLGMKFVLINPGKMIVGRFQPTVGKKDFQGNLLPDKLIKASEEMGSKDAMPGFTATINHAYYIGRFEITQEQWHKVMGNNPSVFKNNSSSDHPVDNITWKDAQDFVKKLNGLDIQHRYRLPTEFEWEFAARAGAEDDILWKDIQASAVLGGSMPAGIGTKQPNAWGLYDMLGNVWEWVQDSYNEKIFADPLPPTSGKEHVLKGSSFTGDVKNATYMTHAAGPGNGFDIGLRLVMEAE